MFTKTYGKMFLASLFITAKYWKQLRYQQLMNGKHVWYNLTMEYHWEIKINVYTYTLNKMSKIIEIMILSKRSKSHKTS